MYNGKIGVHNFWHKIISSLELFYYLSSFLSSDYFISKL